MNVVIMVMYFITIIGDFISIIIVIIVINVSWLFINRYECDLCRFNCLK